MLEHSSNTSNAPQSEHFFLPPGYWFVSILVFFMFIPFLSDAGEKTIPPVRMEKGRLVYTSDSLGNRIPDYSYCGYLASNEKIPTVPVKVIIPAIDGDATAILQKAIDYVAERPIDKNGFRGAILLEPGRFHIEGRLKITSSGIVIRGSGFSENKTTLIASGISRETLFRIEGEKQKVNNKQLQITDQYVPVNAFSFSVENTKGLKHGTKIFITRPSTPKWIHQLKMESYGGETNWLGWKAGERNIVWERTITKVEGNKVTIDAPLTTALDKKYGGGYLNTFEWNGRVTKVGIENIHLESTYNPENLKDEEHCWNAVSFENARDCWVRQVTFKHFAGSAVATFGTTSRITVEDCIAKEPISEEAAYRRNSFFTSGQQVLFQRCYAEFGWHDFSTGFMAAGPNAFVQCESHLPFNFSGTADSWASGVLFDIVKVDGQKLSFNNIGQDAQGAGWTAANSMFWQCSAARIECFAPKGANNWAFGAWAKFAGNGYWYEPNSHINPRSLFYAQLEDRIGTKNLPENPVIQFVSNATSSPTIEMAADIIKHFKEHPAKPLQEWIKETASVRTPISLKTGKDAVLVNAIKNKTKAKTQRKTIPTSIKNGWIVKGNKIVTGYRMTAPWWNLNMKPRGVKRAKPAITRYVPGRVGTGYTDNIDSVIAEMQQKNITVYEQNYALWYDRRRDDHERVRRMDADVWAPFYELPFARTGKELAWDHLSKYDLTKYNPWYWQRLKQFADLADCCEQVLIHQNYFQHNILEAGAHWVDCPWRPVNNINHTDFPEPPPFAGDKRIFIGNQFYDISNPKLRELHRKYIRQCLNSFKTNSCVIQTTSAEYTGPLKFVEFWIDVIAEWEKETGKHELIALSTTKDVQDAILADPVRSKVVDIIDIRYWAYRPDGSAYAPPGGVNLAPRQHARKIKPGKRSFESVYRAVSEYRTKFPDKAVIYSEGFYTRYGWAVFMAGGSMPVLPKGINPELLQDAAQMTPVKTGEKDVFELADGNNGVILYCKNKKSVEIDLTDYRGKFKIRFIKPSATGTKVGAQLIKGGAKTNVYIPFAGDVVVWISKNKR